jgi:hypothetical protein
MLEHETFGLAADLLHAETWNMLEYGTLFLVDLLHTGIWKIVLS